jgi:hypothetical protein
MAKNPADKKEDPTCGSSLTGEVVVMVFVGTWLIAAADLWEFVGEAALVGLAAGAFIGTGCWLLLAAASYLE